MFNKLFGQKDAKPVVQQKDPQETIDKLNTQCEAIKKIKLFAERLILFDCY